MQKPSPVKNELVAPIDRGRAEVDMQVATAHRYPRASATFVERASAMACITPETAESCMYALPRWDAKQQREVHITGKSVRLAEICASCWGNLRVEARITDDDGTSVGAEAVAWDLESNVAVKVEKRRRITTKEGRRYSDDMIITTQNAAASIAFRDAVFRVIPQAYADAVFERAKRAALGDVQALDQRRSRAIAVFGKIGISQERVLRAVGCAVVGEIGEPEIAQLIAIHNAIKEDNDPEKYFPPADRTDVARPKEEIKPEKVSESNAGDAPKGKGK